MPRFSQAQVAFATAVTSASYSSIVATVTAPVPYGTGSGTDGVFSTTDGSAPQAFDTLELSLFGAGSDDNTGSMRVWGFYRDNNTVPLYIPELLVELDGTFSTLTGAATATIANSMRFADTLAAGSADPGRPVILEQSGTANTCIARALLDISGYAFIKFDGKKGTGTNVNAVFRMRGE